MKNNRIKNIGFISTRFKGTDGVSLETEKWAQVLQKLGYNLFYFAGESDRPEEITMIVPEASFNHKEIRMIQRKCFGTYTRTSLITGKIHSKRRILKEALYRFVSKFDIDLIIVENALAIPMNIPLGIAITEFIAETGIPTISHNHDFYWERERFLLNSVQDILYSSFPPNLPSIKHVVINSHAQKELSFRKGISSYIIPNVINFDEQPPGIDDYNKDLRKSLGLKDDDIFFLQPTRVVKRKGIEHAIELVGRLKNPKIKLVITHSVSDEGKEYYKRILKYAKFLNVDLIIRPDIISDKRGKTPDGKKIYSVWDVYPHADLITYPSTYEGFGNAFIEAIYFKKPIVVNSYSIYSTDIKPIGFEVIEMEGYITDSVVKKVKFILNNLEAFKKHAERNFKLGKRFFSYSVLKEKLKTLINEFHGLIEIIENENGKSRNGKTKKRK